MMTQPTESTDWFEKLFEKIDFLYIYSNRNSSLRGRASATQLEDFESFLVENYINTLTQVRENLREELALTNIGPIELLEIHENLVFMEDVVSKVSILDEHLIRLVRRDEMRKACRQIDSKNLREININLMAELDSWLFAHSLESLRKIWSLLKFQLEKMRDSFASQYTMELKLDSWEKLPEKYRNSTYKALENQRDLIDDFWIVLEVTGALEE